MLDFATLNKLRALFVTKDRDSYIDAAMHPSTTDTYDLGKSDQRWDVIYAQSVIADNLSGGTGFDHGALAGLGDDDHTQYMHISSSRTVTAQHTFNPSGSPFIIGASAEDNFINGLNADQLDNLEAADFLSPSYIVISLDSNLTGERSLVDGDGIALADGGAGSTATLSVDETYAFTWTAQHTFNPSGAPFIIGASAQNNLVSGLNADQLDGYEATEILSPTYVTLSTDTNLTNERVLTGGDGLTLTDGGAGSTATLDVGVSGLGLSVDGTNVTLSSSSNPGADTAAILASDASGYLQLIGLGIGAAVSADNRLLIVSGGDLVFAGVGDINTTGDFDVTISTGNFEFQQASSILTSTGNLTLGPISNLVLSPSDKSVLPGTAYTINLGALNNKYLTLYAAELWVETLVAQDTMATIGGRVIVTATTKFVADLADTSVNGSNQVLNNSFETAGGGSPDIFANWSETLGDGNIADETTIVHDGSHSCKMFSGPSSNTVINQTFTVSPADEIIYSFWTRGDGTYAGQYRIRDLTNGADILAQTSTGVTGTTYTKIFYKFTVPALCTSIRIYFYCPSTNGGTAYFDLVEMYDGVDLRVEHNQMADGDIARAEANGSVEWFEIYDGPTEIVAGEEYQYWVLRDLDGSGENNWYKGSALMNTGVTGEGFIDLYSYSGVLSGSGPTIAGNVRTGPLYNDIEERWAIGNLNGLFGAGAVYGAAFGDPEGTYIQIDDTNGFRIFNTSSAVIGQWDTGGNLTIGLSTKESIYITSSTLSIKDEGTDRITLDHTNGLQIKNSAGTTVLQLDASGNAHISQKMLMLGSSSAISIGTTPPASSSEGSGIWLDRTGFYGLDNNVQQILIDGDDGVLYAGSSNQLILDADGIAIAAQTVYTDTRAYKINHGTTTFLTLSGYYTEGPSYNYGGQLTVDSDGHSKNASLSINAEADSSYTGSVQLYADAGPGAVVTLQLAASSTNNDIYMTTATTHISGDVEIGLGLYVGSDVTPPTSDYDIRAEGDLIVGGGIYAGNADYSDVTDGDIVYEGGLYARPVSTLYDVYGFHPVSPTELTDTSNNTWNFSYNASTGTYVFDHDLYNSWPTSARALLVMFGVNFGASPSASDTVSMRRRSGSTNEAQIRGDPNQGSYLTTMSAIVPCDTSGDVELVVVNSSVTQGGVRMIGYFL